MNTQVVLITGGLTGIGRACRAFSARVNCFPVRRDLPETGSNYRIGDYIVRTARNRALPSATRS